MSVLEQYLWMVPIKAQIESWLLITGLIEIFHNLFPCNMDLIGHCCINMGTWLIDGLMGTDKQINVI